ncbi:hypothetical protein ABK040_000081 [Willaertia magna]
MERKSPRKTIVLTVDPKATTNTIAALRRENQIPSNYVFHMSQHYSSDLVVDTFFDWISDTVYGKSIKQQETA